MERRHTSDGLSVNFHKERNYVQLSLVSITVHVLLWLTTSGGQC